MRARELISIVQRACDQAGLRRKVLDVQVLTAMQVVRRKRIERRWVLLTRTGAAADEPESEGPAVAIDPWTTDLACPELGEAATILYEEERIEPCLECHASGRITCLGCDGSGLNEERLIREVPEPCPRCRGTGRMLCETCQGTMRSRVTPRVHAVQQDQVRCRAVEDASLPDSVMSRRAERAAPGEVVARLGADEAPRGAAAVAADAVRGLSAEREDPGTRVAKVEIEIRKVPVYCARLAGGQTTFLLGDPPELLSEDVPPIAPTGQRIALLVLAILLVLAYLAFAVWPPR